MSTPYDQLPYYSKATSWTHPEQLAARARLYGLRAPSIERSRVLELGCGTGENLVAMAVTLPEASFVGVDASEVQIRAGREQLATLGIHNVDLRHGLAEELETDEGFDYVVIHGFLSWVPPGVARAVLELTGRVLAPEGVAFVSFNTLPGWNAGMALRQLILPALQGTEDPLGRVALARELMETAAQAAPPGLWGDRLRAEVAHQGKLEDWLLCHDLISEHNHAFWLSDLLSLAEECGLQYLSRAESRPEVPLGAPKAELERLSRALPGPAGMAWATDLVRGRRFRCLLLAGQGAPVEDRPSPETLRSLHLHTRARPVDGRPVWKTRDGQEFSSDKPAVRAALGLLSHNRPRGLSWDQILAGVRARVPLAEEEELALAERLLVCVDLDMVKPCLGPGAMAIAPGSHPRTTELVRLQVALGKPEVASLRHDMVVLRELDVWLLPRLDGTRTRAALVAERLQEEGRVQAPADWGARASEVAALIDDRLAAYGRAALLVP